MPKESTFELKRKEARRNIRWLWLTAVVIVLDQMTKYWAEHILGKEDKVVLFSWFDLSLAHNPGAAFGFLSQAGGWQHVFFVSLAITISGALIWMIRQLEAGQRHLAIAYALIIGGALGNAIDRFIYQYVVDFIHWFYQSWHYPHFNVADMAICAGAFLLITESFGWAFLDVSVKDEEND